MRDRPGLPITELAAAKVNLTLEILGRRSDGYHELSSLVAFAGIGDRLDLSPAAEWSSGSEGPMAAAIEGSNLVDRAAESVRLSWPGAAMGHLDLYKVLPVAAGIGGGSADAAATLRALKRLNQDRDGAPDWIALARRLGADVPVCLIGKLAFMRGIGERLDPLDLAVQLPAVLVNPGVPLTTASVFAKLAAPRLPEDGTEPPLPVFRDRGELVAWVAESRNDLEAPALRLAPIVGRVQAALQASPGCQLARLSGSGPTCFGLFETADHAVAAAQAIGEEQPDWWVRATTLG